MSETRFTPGPWHVGATPVETADEAVQICRENIEATKVPDTHFYEVYCETAHRTALVGNGPTNHWNAYLIAAAPDLYNAVEKQHAAIDHLLALLIAKDPEFMPTQSKVSPLLMDADAPRVLAKARGE